QAPDRNGVAVNLGSSSVLHRTNVEYPEAAIAKGIQGTVSVEATVDSTGNVVDARVLTGPQELRRSVLQSVLQWHFTPTTGQNTRVVQIAFDLAAAQKARTEVAKTIEQRRMAEQKILEARTVEAPKTAQNFIFTARTANEEQRKAELEAVMKKLEQNAE